MTDTIALPRKIRDRMALPPIEALPAVLAAAPHRLMFFAGASAILTSMLWWAAVLCGARFGFPHMPPAPVPPGWAHAILTQYGMLPLFVLGFLLTVFPRWTSQPALPRSRYVPVFAGMFGGYLVAHAGLLDTRRHASNYAGYVDTYVPAYVGAALCDATALAVTDDGVISAGGVGGIEFAREVIRALNLYDARDTEAWYRLFKHAVPPPWIAAAPDTAIA